MSTRYRIVETDNYASDWPDESFLQLPLMSKTDAERVAMHINACFLNEHPRFWRAVPENYTLKPGFEP